MLVNLGTKRVKNNRIKVKTGSSCVYKESLIYSVYLVIYLLHVLLYESLWRIHCKLHSQDRLSIM